MPALPVPGSFAVLLSLLAPAFSAPSFETFCWLAVGFVTRVGDHTVTGMLQAARLERRWHHTRAHEFFSRREWCPDKVGLLLLDFLVARFVAADAPILVAVDDTLFRRSGKKVYGARWQYDGSVPAGAGHQTGFGNNWVALTLVVRLPILNRAVGLPVLFRLWIPEPRAKGEHKNAPRRPNPAYPSKPELIRQLLDLLIARYPSRRIELVGDSAYATKAFAGLPAHVNVTSRLKTNAALYAPKPPRTGKRGRPAEKGARLPSLQQIADNPKTAWTETETTNNGKTKTMLTHTCTALWYGVWAERPVRVVLVKTAKRAAGYDIALVSTDTTATPAELIARYEQRWAIEVAFEDAKQITGVGQARNRVRKAVERTVPFGLLCQSLVIVWYALNGDAARDVQRRRWQAPWYHQKRAPSYHDMLTSLRREVITAQYHAVTAPTAKQPQIQRPAHALTKAVA